MHANVCASFDVVLPNGVGRELGAPPPPPVDFENGYVLPAHSEKPLQVINGHPLDARLVFHEAPHVYEFDGVPTSASVTALAHAYEKPFVAADAIQSMKGARSQAWPRLEYVSDAREGAADWTPERGVLLVRAGRTVAALPPHSLRADADVAEALRAAAPGDDEDEEVHTYARALTDTEIAEGWSRKGRIASHRGTEAHYLAECYFNGLPVRWWEPEMRVLFAFVRDHMLPRGIVAHRTEMEIVCADADVAGSIDLIAWDAAAGLYHIVDHKRSDKLQRDLRGFGKMGGEFAHLDSCKGAGYALQTSIYQYILEREYGMDIGDRVLLSLHPDVPFCTSVPYMRAEVEYVMESRMATVRARRALAADDPQWVCALSGAPAVDAVRLADGRRAMEKAALARGVAFEPDEAARVDFEAAVALRRECVELRKAGCSSWRKRMPEAGIVPFS